MNATVANTDRMDLLKGVDRPSPAKAGLLNTVEAGWTQEGLEEASGVSQAVISSIERGDTLNPSFDTVKRLAAALGLDPRHFDFSAPEERA